MPKKEATKDSGRNMIVTVGMVSCVDGVTVVFSLLDRSGYLQTTGTTHLEIGPLT